MTRRSGYLSTTCQLAHFYYVSLDSVSQFMMECLPSPESTFIDCDVSDTLSLSLARSLLSISPSDTPVIGVVPKEATM